MWNGCGARLFRTLPGQLSHFLQRLEWEGLAQSSTGSHGACAPLISVVERMELRVYVSHPLW